MSSSPHVSLLALIYLCEVEPAEYSSEEKHVALQPDYLWQLAVVLQEVPLWKDNTVTYPLLSALNTKTNGYNLSVFLRRMTRMPDSESVALDL